MLTSGRIGARGARQKLRSIGKGLSTNRAASRRHYSSLPFLTSCDVAWKRVLPATLRALLVVHGCLRLRAICGGLGPVMKIPLV